MLTLKSSDAAAFASCPPRVHQLSISSHSAETITLSLWSRCTALPNIHAPTLCQLPTLVMDALPPELILLVLQHAAVKPEVLGWTGWSKGVFILRQRMALLRRCSLVCRAWRPCAQSLLFETLYIDASSAKRCPEIHLYPTKRVELEVPNKLDLKGAEAARRVVEKLQGVEQLALEVSEKVGGDWTDYLKMDSMRGESPRRPYLPPAELNLFAQGSPRYISHTSKLG